MKKYDGVFYKEDKKFVQKKPGADPIKKFTLKSL